MCCKGKETQSSARTSVKSRSACFSPPRPVPGSAQGGVIGPEGDGGAVLLLVEWHPAAPELSAQGIPQHGNRLCHFEGRDRH